MTGQAASANSHRQPITREAIVSGGGFWPLDAIRLHPISYDKLVDHVEVYGCETSSPITGFQRGEWSPPPKAYDIKGYSDGLLSA